MVGLLNNCKFRELIPHIAPLAPLELFLKSVTDAGRNHFPAIKIRSVPRRLMCPRRGSVG